MPGTDEPVFQALMRCFTGLSSLSAVDRATLADGLGLVRVPADTVVFRPGDACQSYLLLLDGSVRVHMLAENGREILLYRVGPGDTCVVTTACLLSGEPYSLEGRTETPVQAAVLPLPLFNRLMDRAAPFRSLVFATMGARLADVMRRLEDVAFQRVDRRLARLLLDRAGPDGVVEATHQSLADELGSVREVVSRQLSGLEQRGLVGSARGKVTLLDIPGLQTLSGRPVL